jgi:hypothetical protein
MKRFNGILSILFMVGVLLQCSSSGTNSEAAPKKPPTTTEKLATDLKAEYGTFTHTYYDSPLDWRKSSGCVLACGRLVP